MKETPKPPPPVKLPPPPPPMKLPPPVKDKVPGLPQGQLFSDLSKAVLYKCFCLYEKNRYRYCIVWCFS